VRHIVVSDQWTTLVAVGVVAVGELRLEVQGYAGPGRWRWVLTGPEGALVSHDVQLKTDCWQFEASTDMARYLRWHVAPDQRITEETQIVDAVGAWIGENVLGPVGPAMAGQQPTAVRLVVPEAPAEAAWLMFVPLALGHVAGRPVGVQDVTLVVQHSGQADEVSPVGERLRVLGLFSLPSGSRPLNLRQERCTLVRLFAEIGASGRAVDVRALQYGVTRQQLREVLQEEEGWDLIHVSGHGTPGELRLEAEDGSADPVSAAELADLLDLARARLKLVTLSACSSGAPTLAEQRRLLKLPEPDPSSGTDGPAGRPAGERPVGGLATELAGRLACGVLAMRYPVEDDFAVALAAKLYPLLAGDGLPLPQALGTVLRDPEVIAAPPTARCPALSVAAPALFGSAATALRLSAPEHDGPAAPSVEASKLAGFPPQPDRFVGRTGVMARASAALAVRSGRPGVLLHGMPGGGKTACAVELAYTLEHAFETLIWFKAPDEGLDIADTLTRFALTLEKGLPGPQMMHLLDDPAQFAAFLPALTERLRQQRVLIVIDNIESLLSDRDTWCDQRWGAVVAALCGHAGLGRIVLTSRRRPDDLDPRVPTEAVDALTLDEALLLVRQLPNLSKLIYGRLDGIEPDVARALARQILQAAQGHPTLLELADAQAADPGRLQTLIETADAAWRKTGTLPEGFFSSGKAGMGGEEYRHVLAAWTRAAAAGSAPAERDLFEFLCCLEEGDRIRFALDPTWPRMWQDLSRAGDPPDLGAGLAALSAAGLLAIQPGDAEQTTSYRIHPAVADEGRDLAGGAFRELADNDMGGFWSAAATHAKDREAQGLTGGGWVVWGGLKAAPYLMRLRSYSEVRLLLDEALTRDMSAVTAASTLPVLRKVAEAVAGTVEEPAARSLVAKARARINPAPTERQMRELLATAVDQADFASAAIAAGDLVQYFLQAGQPGEALAPAEDVLTYTRQAGLGPWSQFGGEVQRLQVLAAMGRSEQVLTELPRLREQMESLPPASDQQEVAEPWNLREALFDTGRQAATSLHRWDEALEFNAQVVASQRSRSAPAALIAESKFNDNGPLIELGQLKQALKLLLECRAAFEQAHDVTMLGKVFYALAIAETKRGHGEIAISTLRDALRYSYRAEDADNIEGCHDELGDQLRQAGQPGAALPHHLAAALLRSVTGARAADILASAAAAGFDLGVSDATVPADVAELCRQVAAVPGVDLDRLLIRLAPDRPAVEQALTRLAARASRQAGSLAATASALAASSVAVPPEMGRWLAEWDGVIAGMAATVLGTIEAADFVDQYLAALEGSSDWATLSAALRSIQKAESRQNLSAGMDQIDTLVLNRALTVLAGKADVPLELWPAMGLGTLLGDMVAAGRGDTAAAGRAGQELPNLAAVPDWAALARALDRILNGERDPGLSATLSERSHRAAVATVLHYIGIS
jgi:hypothetical protein